jgi:hypothetical protein
VAEELELVQEDELQERLVQRLRERLVQRAEQRERLVQLPVLVLVQQLRHHSREQLSQVSRKRHASTVCCRRFSTANCRGQSASCQKLC